MSTQSTHTDMSIVQKMAEHTAELTSELTLRRLADEQLAPIRAELSRLNARSEAMALVVLGGNGSPSLGEQLRKLGEDLRALTPREECRYSREQCRSEILTSISQLKTDARDTLTLRERAKGAAMAIGSACGLGGFVWKLLDLVIHHHP